MRIDVFAVMDTRSHSRLPGLRCILVTFGAGGIHIGSQGHTAWSCEVSGPHTGRVGGTRRIGKSARVHGAGRFGGTSALVPRPGGGAGWGPIGQGRHGGGGHWGCKPVAQGRETHFGSGFPHGRQPLQDFGRHGQPRLRFGSALPIQTQAMDEWRDPHGSFERALHDFQGEPRLQHHL